MTKFSTAAIVVVTLAFIIPTVYAADYETPQITHIAAGSGGEVYIKWAGSPRPGPCGGENFGWVVIPSSASEALKSLALSIYFSGKPARIHTSGCTGTNENVVTLYSPGG